MIARASSLLAGRPLKKKASARTSVGTAKGVVVRKLVLSRARDCLVLRLVENVKARTKAKPNERTAR